MSENAPIVTLDVVLAPTDRAKCYNCTAKIKRGSWKGHISVMVDVQNKVTGEIKQVQQNRSLCVECVRTNIQALYGHLNRLAQKIGM